MVQLTSVNYVLTSTFGVRVRGKMFNHRKPLQFKKFKPNLDPEKIVELYSREDVDDLDPKFKKRSFKDAQKGLGRTTYLLENLSNDDLKKNQVFQQELERQRSLIARVEKIKVIVDTKPYVGTELIMNKHLSTPFDCARHLHEYMTQRSVVAEVSSLDKTDNSQGPLYWDMHRPLVESCSLKLRHFVENNVNEVNRIYWRSCSMMLGMAMRVAFKDKIKVLLHSWPKPDIKSGSFVYDVALNFTKKWNPSDAELRSFTKVLWKIKDEALPFERLLVNVEVAKQLFSDNPFKLSCIDDMADNGKVAVYRCGGLLDLSIGPMIANTGQIGRISLASVHSFASPSKGEDNVFYRFQGVSVPQQLPISSFVYQNLIVDRARELNKVAL